MICPLLIPLFPSRDVLHDQIWALFQGFGARYVPIESKGTSRVVDGDETLPLLNSEWFVWRDTQADHLTLGVEGIEIDVGDDA